jgi:prepilin-type N-terminal cleavage/methylation domain-containing protein/prepilin-type processing-associated H-X9-DG protein
MYNATRSRRPRAASPRKAFTLVELLVVIAIIALLISILLPSLRSARDLAKASACGGQMRSVGTGMMAYLNTANEWLPGANTSGVGLRSLQVAAISGEEWRLMNPKLPVQTYDWLTPILAQDGEVPKNRAKRFQMVTNMYHCPSQTAVDSRLYPFSGTGVPDWDDFVKEGNWNALSYLMPVHFQRWGSNYSDRVVGNMLGYDLLKLYAETQQTDWEAYSEDYISKLSRVGPPGRKVMAADGTRYLTDEAILDHDVNPWPNSFGSFTSSGAWWEGSTAYGVKQGSENYYGGSVSRGSPSDGRNLELSYRHVRKRDGNGGCLRNAGTMNVLFFDGHIDRLGDEQSRNIDLWYPKGTKVKIPDSGLTFVEDDYIVN